MTTEKQEAAAAESTSKTASGRSRGDGVDDASPEVALKCQKVAEGDKAEAGKGKRMGRVSQEYIDLLLHEIATGTGAYKKGKSKAMELVDKYYKGRHDLRAEVARGEAIMEQLRAGDAAILEQYHRLGYAECEMEEDDSFIYDEKIFGPIARSKPPPQIPPA